MLGMEALQGLWVVFACYAPDGECALWVLHYDDPLCLHVDHGLERIWQQSVPLSDLRPDRVAQLILGVRRNWDFAVLAGEQEPHHKPRLQRGLPHAMARPNRHTIMFAYSFEGFCLPRLWYCAENVPDKDQRYPCS